MRKLFAPLILVLVLAGCAGVPSPETPRERLAAAEVTYQAAVTSVRDFATQGILQPSTPLADRAATAIIAARAALDAWQIVPDNEDELTTALTALQALQGFVNELRLQSLQDELGVEPGEET